MNAETPYVIDFRDPAQWQDPYPAFREARRRGRTALTHDGERIILNADDAEAIHLDPHFITPGLYALERLGICDGPFYEWRARTLNVMNGPEHARLRSFVGPAFSPRQMERLRLIARDIANALLDRVAARGEMDVVEDFAGDLPLSAMCRFVGIADDDREALGRSLVGTEAAFSEKMTPELRASVEASITALNAFAARLIEDRRRAPKDDMVSALVAGQSGDHGPSEEDFLALLVNIIGGAVGSTRAALSNSILAFSENPHQVELFRRHPERLRLSAEECLRYHSPFRLGRRIATKNVTIAGLDVKEGENLVFARQAINRDPTRFENPDVFDIMRPERRNFSFAYGPHFCLGQAVARTNVQIALSVFLNRFGGFQIVSPPERVPFVPEEQIRNLRITFRPLQ